MSIYPKKFSELLIEICKLGMVLEDGVGGGRGGSGGLEKVGKKFYKWISEDVYLGLESTLAYILHF